jgi:hypothetical protein
MLKLLALLWVIVIIAAILLPIAVIASWIWNSVAVSVFGFPHLTALQMYGIIWLVHLILPFNISSEILNKDR